MDISEYNSWLNSLKKNDLVAVEIKENARYFIREVGEVGRNGVVYIGGNSDTGTKYVNGEIVDPDHPWVDWKIVPITEQTIEFTEQFDLYSRLEHIRFVTLSIDQLKSIYKIIIKSGKLDYYENGVVKPDEYGDYI